MCDCQDNTQHCLTLCEQDHWGPWPTVWASVSMMKRTRISSKMEFKTFKINFTCYFNEYLLGPLLGSKWSFTGRRNENLKRWSFCRYMGDCPGQDTLKMVERPALRTPGCPPSTHVSDTCSGASSLRRNGWSAATLRVLSSMPSRTAGEIKFCW